MNDCWVDVDLRRYHAGKPSEFGERIEVLVRIPEQVAKKLAGPGREPGMDIERGNQNRGNAAVYRRRPPARCPASRLHESPLSRATV